MLGPIRRRVCPFFSLPRCFKFPNHRNRIVDTDTESYAEKSFIEVQPVHSHFLLFVLFLFLTPSFLSAVYLLFREVKAEGCKPPVLQPWVGFIELLGNANDALSSQAHWAGRVTASRIMWVCAVARHPAPPCWVWAGEDTLWGPASSNVFNDYVSLVHEAVAQVCCPKPWSRENPLSAQWLFLMYSHPLVSIEQKRHNKQFSKPS